MERNKRWRSRPSLEGLEGRQLLTSTQVDVESILQRRHVSSTSPLAQTSNDVTFDYTTAQGSKVDISLIGPGSLAGTSVDSSGNLNLVFSGTTVFSSIIGTVKGGTGQANLATIKNANVALTNLTGLNGELLGRILLPNFNLIGGGDVNLSAGVQVFTLNSVAANSQVHLRDTPLNTSLGLQSYENTVTGTGVTYATLSSTSTGATSSSAGGLSSGTSIGVATGQSAGGVTTIGTGTLNPTAVGFGGGEVGAINGAIPIVNTVGNGENYLGTPGLTQSQVEQGRSLTYVIDSTGGTQLSAIAGTFMPGANLIEPSDISLPPTRIPPPGVIVTINHVNGQASSSTTPPLGDAQIYGYDPTANALIRFDAVTGAQLGSIPLPASTTGVGGVSIARDGAELVVLVGIGSNVYAYDATTEAAVGSFSINSLIGEGFTAVTGISTGSQNVILADAADTSTGTLQAINLAQSLATGDAVAVNAPYSPAREFSIAGNLTSVPGTGNVFALGSGFFDTTQPNAKQAGILTVTPGTTGLSESTRTVLTSKSTGLDVPAGSNNGIAGSSSIALGSIDSFLAVDEGSVNGVNLVNLYTPNGLTSEGSVTLADANSLAALSQSFHPELTNTALIDVQGNVQTFTAKSVNGLVLNVAGNFNLLQANTATNSSVIGLPFAHVSIKNRSNVSIITNSRLVGTRGGVTVNASQKEVGPLFLD
jgi:hypothetical protein